MCVMRLKMVLKRERWNDGSFYGEDTYKKEIR